MKAMSIKDNLSVAKIKNMLGAHNDGVFNLHNRNNLPDIVEFLLTKIESQHWLLESCLHVLNAHSIGHKTQEVIESVLENQNEN